MQYCKAAAGAPQKGNYQIKPIAFVLFDVVTEKPIVNGKL